MTSDLPTISAEGLDFRDHSVVIAGGTSGVGLATGTAFARSGCRRIVLIGRNGERGKAAADRVATVADGVEVTFLSADLTDPEAVTRVAEEAERVLGGIDVLVNSTVAPYKPAPLIDIPLAELRAVLVEQAVAPMLLTRAVLPVMRRAGAGAIVTLASDAAKVPTPGETGIGAAMAAIVNFSQTLAVEARRDGIRVNVLTPSMIVNTGSNERMLEDDGFSRKLFERISRLAEASLGYTEPEDLAHSVLFLASPLARRITGQVISVNGGISVS